MSADKTTRLDLLHMAYGGTLPGASLSVKYRGHKIAPVRLPGFAFSFEVDPNTSECYDIVPRSRETADVLQALRDLDYLIDVLDNVDEPNLKED